MQKSVVCFCQPLHIQRNVAESSFCYQQTMKTQAQMSVVGFMYTASLKEALIIT